MHPKLIEWDETMKSMFDRVDAILEERHAGRWRLRRNRPARGETANPEADGLFDVGVTFTPGYGSEHGRGYLLVIDLATHDKVDPRERETIEHEVLELLDQFLPEFFPGRDLEVVRDGSSYKLLGDFSLGKVQD